MHTFSKLAHTAKCILQDTIAAAIDRLFPDFLYPKRVEGSSSGWIAPSEDEPLGI